jgi:hypothetical protein
MKKLNKSWKDHKAEMLKKDNLENYRIVTICLFITLLIVTFAILPSVNIDFQSFIFDINGI